MINSGNWQGREHALHVRIAESAPIRFSTGVFSNASPEWPV